MKNLFSLCRNLPLSKTATPKTPVQTAVPWGRKAKMVLKGEPDSSGPPASQPGRVQSLTNVPLALPSTKPSLGLPVLPSTFPVFSEV